MKNFEKSFEWWGGFWLPQDEESTSKYMYGVLSFDYQNGGELKVLDPLQNERYRRCIDFFNEKSIDIIHGISNNKYLTLENNRVRRCSGSYPELFEFLVGRIYEGHLFDKKEDITFNNLHLQYTRLHQWMSTHVARAFRLRPQMVFNEKGEAVREEDFEFSYNPPDSINLLNDEFNIYLNMHPLYGHDMAKGVYAGIDVQVDIESCNGAIPVEDYLYLVRFKVASFFTLLTGIMNQPICISGRSGEERDIKIFDRLLKYESVDKYEWKGQYALVDFNDVQEEIQSYFRNWMSKFKSKYFLKTAEQFFGEDHSFFADEKLLSLAKALEIFIKHLINNKDLPKPEKRLKMEESYVLLYSYLILRGYGNELKNLFGDKCPRCFGRQLTWMRNELTHLDPKNVDRETRAVLDRLDLLHDYKNRLRILLEICLLIEIGMSDAKIKDIIARKIKKRQISLPLFLGT